MKRMISVCLCFILLLSLCVPAWADNQSRTVIGADLNQEQVEAVYQSFGLRRGDVIELTMTNAEERQYLQGLIVDLTQTMVAMTVFTTSKAATTRAATRQRSPIP